ncbi:SBBP repeat-containing protein, partial [Dolichospermum sp. ST_sed5]|nr:SBBP repeat-containing protein [Dolichospermum sp. ST_sed5]MDD1463773.1 SBBP repeat-containing protein [Dolichospermum sp. ST_sed5]
NGTTADDSYIGGLFNNTGTVQVKKGTLRLIGGGTNTGSFSIDNGATLKLSSDYNFNAGNSVTGAGNFNIESGIITVNTASTWSNPITLTGGTLTGAGALTISNLLNWNSGTLSGTGKKTVSGTLNLSGSQTLDGTTLETTGATVWTGNGTLYATNAATWNNTSTGTIDLQGDADFYQYSGAQLTFNNAGTLTKSNGTTADDSYIGGLFNNTGTVQVKKGRLRFTGGYTQTAGTTNISGGSLAFDNSPLNLQGGTLNGTGTITGNVNNTGSQVNPGNTIGTLNITGNYSQSGTGILNLELGSATSFDKFAITGAADLGGTLKLNLTSGFTPTIGTKFAVLTYGSATLKSFNNIQGIDISSSLAFAPTSTGNNLTLEVVDQVKDLGAINFLNPQSVTDFVGDTDLSDFYRFNVTTASNVQVKLTNLTTNADVWLVDGLGRTIAKGIKTGTADELFNWAVDTGTYYVKVFRPAAGNNTNYTLQVATSTAIWPVQFGTSGQERNSGVSNDRAGSVFAAGLTTGAFAGNTNAGDTDGYISKYNPDGSQAWVKQFGTSGTDYAIGTGNDNAGNVYSTGYTNGAFTGATNLGSNDGFITKYTSTGTLAWVKQFGTAADDTSFGISVDSNGNSYIIGKTSGAFAGNVTQGAYDAYIAKYDTNGTQTWIKQFGTNQDDETIGVSIDSNDNIYVLGSTVGAFAGNTNASGYDVFVSKYNSSGTQAWVKQLGSSGNNYANINGISTDSTGNVFITGFTDGTFSGNTSLGSYDGFVAKYSTTGTLAWVKQFGTTSEDYSAASKTDSVGNTYVTGWTSGQFTGNTALGGYDGFLAKYDTSGTRLWVKQFGTNSNDYANGLSIDNLGNIYISGWTEGSFPTYTNQGVTDSYIALFDTNGNQLSIPAIPALITVAATDSNAGETATGVTPNPGTFTLTRTRDLSKAITVNYTLSGSATNGTDYSNLTGTVSFAAGVSSATVTVTPTDDNIFEVTETAVLTLTSGTGYILGTTSSATVNITDNDPQPTISINDVAVIEGNSGTTNATFTVTLSNTSSQPITVNYATANGTATTADLDYNAANATISFAPGEISKTVTVAVVGDTKSENPEAFTVNLSNVTNATITKATGVGTITNDDLPIITVAATDSDAGETATGITPNPGAFTVTRNGDLTQAITVNYTLSGSATNGTDYNSLPGTINFAAGASTAIVTVTPTDDNIFEGTETAIFTLATGTGYALDVTNSVTVNIADNDLPSISLAVSPASVIEDGPTNLVYTFTRTGTTANALTVNYGVGGTAIFNTDYTQTGATSLTATTGTITFAAGSSTASLTVDPTADTTVEPDETVVISLATATGYTINTTTAVTGTITNDDSSALPVITVAATDASAAETAIGVMPNPSVFTLTRLGGNINQPLTVTYSLTGTATNGADYTSVANNVIFAAGSNTATVTLTPIDDTIFEGTETAILTLVNGTAYTLGTTANATVSIADNDLQPTANLSATQTILEGNTNPQNVTYTVTLSNTSTRAVTVNYATADGTAKAGLDYSNTTGSLTFNPGVKTQVINIPILNDALNEANETLNLNLTSATNATLGTTKTVATTITDTLRAAITTILPDGVENLTLTGTSAINGTGNAGDNVFTGNSGNNTLTGLDGNDTYAFSVIGVLGTDTIVETATGGIDTINFTGTTAAVNMNLAVTTSQTVNSNLKLILFGNNVIENVTGSAGNDRLTGNALDNLLVGGAGNDKLQGLAGNDLLWGGLGNDILTGGVGNDQYLFQNNGVFSTGLGVDYIPQFDAGQDKIVLSLSTFNAITNTVGQALSDFAVVTDDELVNVSNARIVYSQSTGSLFYNQDGNVLGAGTVFEFAQLGNLDITLSGSDFSLIV